MALRVVSGPRGLVVLGLVVLRVRVLLRAWGVDRSICGVSISQVFNLVDLPRLSGHLSVGDSLLVGLLRRGGRLLG